MIKRLLIIAAFTGAAYVFTLEVLKYLSQTISPAALSSVAETDSLTNLLTTILASGLLMAAVRDIAISEDWKLKFREAQQARLTASLLIVPFGLLGAYHENYFLFMFAPAFALNGDYALYGRSFPVTASIITFIRILVPYLVLVVASVYGSEWLIGYFVLSIVVVYIFTGSYISYILKIPYFIRPSAASLYRYLTSLRLGIVSLSYYFNGLGIIFVAAALYDDGIVAIAFLGIKLYTIFKGVIRIINQAFTKEMLNESVCQKVDQLTSVSSILFLASTVLFPHSFTEMLLGREYLPYMFTLVLLAIAGFISSAFISLATTVILRKKDVAYSRWSTASILVSVGCLAILSFIWPGINSIYISLILGETISTIGVLLTVANYGTLKPRLIELFRFTPFLLIAIAARLLLGDTYISFTFGIGLTIAIYLATQYRKFQINFAASD